MFSKSLTKKYDVISVSHYFYPRVGGLENMAYAVLTNYAKAGLKGLAVHGNGKHAYYHLNNFDCQSFHATKLINGTYPVFGLRFAWYMFRLLKRNPQALVLVYDRHLTSSFITALACKLLGQRFVLVSQTTSSNYLRNRVLNKVANMLDTYVFSNVVRWADRIVSVSEANKQYQIDTFGVSADKFTTIYNCFNQELISKFNIDNKQKIVAFVTKWIPVKDPDTVAKAYLELARKHSDWRFIFAGEGECFISGVSNLPENLEVIPRFLTQVELFELMSKSAVYINASINEGLSLNVAEAAALGNIPVLSDAPSNIEVSHRLNSNKYTFQRGNVSELVTKVESAMADFADNGISLSKAVSEAAYEHFAQDSVMEQYQTFARNYVQTKALVQALQPVMF